jgi:hypothetical protein
MHLVMGSTFRGQAQDATFCLIVSVKGFVIQGQAQSHYSRFLQVADLIVYMAGRYEHSTAPATSLHEKEIEECWKKIKASDWP